MCEFSVKTLSLKRIINHMMTHDKYIANYAQFVMLLLLDDDMWSSKNSNYIIISIVASAVLFFEPLQHGMM